jgi:hypothetical protein
MEDISSSKPFNVRTFCSVGMIVTSIILILSGLRNHLLQFDAFSQTRHYWMAVHNMAGSLFVLFAIVHMILNRRALKNYLFQKGKFLISKESLIALILIGGIVFLFASHALLVE